ncbi:MAG: hypothetical protein OXH94_16150 [Rhodospirillales bacterium]|nr:hypothetical protein [Rhodospirillales bacterium]
MGLGLTRIGTGALVAVLAGCVTAPKTGQENISASESPLLFAHPDGLSMQARHFRRFDPRNTGAKIYRGNWRPSGGGQRPFFFVYYHSAGPGYQFTSTPSDVAKRYVTGLKFGKRGKPALGLTGTAQNKFGVASIQHFAVGDNACFGFVQYFGDATFSTTQGSELLQGFYCGTGAKTLPGSKVSAIMNSIGVKGQHVPPAVAAAVERQRANSPVSNFVVNIDWTGRFDGLSGRMSATNTEGRNGRIAVSLPNRAGTCTGQWQVNTGAYGSAQVPTGTWNLLCTNGLKASGFFASPTRGNGSGSGTDVEGKAVNFSFRPA